MISPTALTGPAARLLFYQQGDGVAQVDLIDHGTHTAAPAPRWGGGFRFWRSVHDDTQHGRPAAVGGRHRQGDPQRARRAGPPGARDRRRQGGRRPARCATRSGRRRCSSTGPAYGERLGLDPAFVRRALSRDPGRLGPAPAGLAPGARAGRAGRCSSASRARRAPTATRRRASTSASSRRPVTLKAYRSFRETLEAVQEGSVERAVLPIENSTAGSVHEVYDLLFRLNLWVVGEEVARHRALPARACQAPRSRACAVSIRIPRRWPSAASSWPRCRTWRRDAAANTALAAARVARLADPAQAAIASERRGRPLWPRRAEARHREPGREPHPVRVVAPRRSTATRWSRPRCRSSSAPATSGAPWSAASTCWPRRGST